MTRYTPKSAPITTLPALAAARAPFAEATPYSPEPWFEMARREFCDDGDARKARARDMQPLGD